MDPSLEQIWQILEFSSLHVIRQTPINSEYRNYKFNFSIVMFTLVGAEYNYMFIDIRC